MQPIRLITGIFTVGGLTFLSRIAGFIRDIFIAAFFGAGPVAEAFQVAFALPNMFRRFFAEGAFNMAFVPMFSKKLQSGDDPKAFAENAFAALAMILLILTTIALIAMPWFVWAMAAGFVGDERFDLATDFGRICFPYILFISLAALCSGVLNANGRFAAAAFAPVLLNVILVGGMALAYFAGWDIATALVWSVPIAGIAQLAFVWRACQKMGFTIAPRLPTLSPELKKLAIIAAPAALAGGVVQINLLVGRQVASQFDGAIQWLAVADRLYQLPLGIVGIAIGVVLLPDLSRRLQSKDAEGGKFAFNRATEFSLALTMPATAALIIMPTALISVLFERGAFLASDSQASGLALAIYSAGLPAFVLQKTYQPLYFAREDTKTPFYFALASMAINAVIAIGLMSQLGYLAAALGTTIAGWGMLALLWNGARKMDGAADWDPRLRQRSLRIVLATLVMSGILFSGLQFFEEMLFQSGVRYIALLVLILVGMISYAVAAFAFGALSKDDLRALKRS